MPYDPRPMCDYDADARPAIALLFFIVAVNIFIGVFIGYGIWG